MELQVGSCIPSTEDRSSAKPLRNLHPAELAELALGLGEYLFHKLGLRLARETWRESASVK